MRKPFILLTAAAVAMGTLVMGATTASADPIDGAVCQFVDYSGPVGTQFVLQVPEGCSLPALLSLGRDPTITVDNGDGNDLIWQQQIERPNADAPCPSGWDPTWAQWPKEGKGGFSCVRNIDWGHEAPHAQSITFTINDETNFVVLDLATWDQYVTGCDFGNTAFYQNHVNACPR